MTQTEPDFCWFLEFHGQAKLCSDNDEGNAGFHPELGTRCYRISIFSI